MADHEELDKPDELVTDELILRLVPDPAKIPNLIVLVGFLGRSSRPGELDDGKYRLYLTPTINDYITFDRTDLVYRQPPPEGSPTVGSIVWLKGDATVQHTHIESHQLQAEFLYGKMMDNAQMSMPDFPKGLGSPGGANFWTYVGCPPSVWRC
jgi:hypothetical protein